MQEWAGEMLALAEGGLARLGNLDASGQDERQYLAPLRQLVEAGDSPADVLLRNVPEPTAAALIQHAAA